mmetsp:Transcript_43470/g.85096  ORF Transcript_43470/g.85096 Transcript_43470/m.85096 type:complete len:169 (+) Transcript_43470:2-508(+)
MDLLSMSNSLSSSWLSRWVLDPALVRSVQQVRRQFQHVLEKAGGAESSEIDTVAVASARTMAEFDHHCISPMMGAHSGSDYYRQASAGPLLHAIRIPVLFLHAKNDPIVPSSKIRLDDFESNPCLLSVMTDFGGHSMDWPTSLSFTSFKSWGCDTVTQFLMAVGSLEV